MDILQVFDYELRASWWAGWLPSCFNDITGNYFLWKTERKCRRFKESEKTRDRLILTGKLRLR